MKLLELFLNFLSVARLSQPSFCLCTLARNLNISVSVWHSRANRHKAADCVFPVAESPFVAITEGLFSVVVEFLLFSG